MWNEAVKIYRGLEIVLIKYVALWSLAKKNLL